MNTNTMFYLSDILAQLRTFTRPQLNTSQVPEDLHVSMDTSPFIRAQFTLPFSSAVEMQN